MVDSGAFRSFFPLQIAHRLGLADPDLAQDPHGAEGVGSKFNTWSSTVPLIGQVIAKLDAGPQLWGPAFSLSPAFGDHEHFLLGRADFFKAFSITFVEDDSAPVFHLDYDPR